MSAEEAPKVRVTEKLVTTRRASYHRSPLFQAIFGGDTLLTMGDLRAFVAGAAQIGDETIVKIDTSNRGVRISAEETEEQGDLAPAETEEKEEDREV